MASIDSNELDAPLVGDGNKSFTGGLVSAAPANTIGADSFADALNMDFDAMGRLVTRRGARSEIGNPFSDTWGDSTQVWSTSSKVWGTSLAGGSIEACFYFDTAADEAVVIARNVSGTRKLTYGKPTTAWADIGGASYAQAPVYFSQLGDRLYYCDGSSALAYITSAYASGAITAGKVTSITITEPGHGYTSVPAITFSSGLATATAVLGYGGKVVSATVTAAGSGYSATTPPTISFAAAPAGGTTATGIVNISQVPSKPKLLTSHTSRLFCTSGDTSIPNDVIYVSDILDGESWDLAGNSIRVGADGDPITALFSWFANYLLVGKERSIWVIDCDPTKEVADWDVKLVNGSVGCCSHDSFCSIGQDAYFLSQTGVHAVSIIQNGAQTVVGLPVSSQVRDLFDRINWSQASKIAGVFYRNKYLLSVPIDGATAPNRIIAFDALRNAWLGLWSGWQCRDFVVTGFSGNQRLSWGDNGGYFWTWDDFTPITEEASGQFQDDTNPIESYVVTRAYDHGEPLCKKLGYGLRYNTENRIDISPNQRVSYSKDLSGTFTTAYNILVPSGTTFQGVARPIISAGLYDCIQIKIRQAAGKLVCSGVAVTAFAEPISINQGSGVQRG